MTSKLNGDQLSGRDLTDAVAERVMGWTDILRHERLTYSSGFPPTISTDAKPFHVRQPVPSYSSSIEAAMQVVEKMRELGFAWQARSNGKGWTVQCYMPIARGCGQTFTDGLLPELICRAALKAMGE